MVDTVPFTGLLAGDNNTTYTANAAVVSGPNGTVVVNNNILINSTGNVGIGTATVTTGYKFQVQGAILTTGNIALQSVGSQFLNNTSDTAAKPGYSWIGDTNSGIFNPSVGTIGFSSVGTEVMRIDTSGNVGINTTTITTGYKFQVQGAILTTGNIALQSVGSQFLNNTSDTAAKPGYSWIGDTNSGIFNPSVGTVGFSSVGIERMRIISSGNVGINTTAPVAMLHVAGNLLVNSNGAASIDVFGEIAEFVHNINGYAQIHVRNANAGISASGDIVVTADNGTDTTNYIDMGLNNSGFADATWTINSANDGYLYTQNGNVSIGTAATNRYINFFTGGGTLAANERMRIDQYGNLSIGTTSVALPVGGRTGVTVSGTTTSIMTLQTGANVRGYLYNDGTNMLLAANTGTLFLQAVASQPVIFQTGAAESMRIDTDKSVRMVGNLAVGSGNVFLSSGTLNTTPPVGAIEYSSPFIYFTPNSTSGRSYIPNKWTYRLTSNAAAIGLAIADVFPTPASLSLEASSVYEISGQLYFLKTTAGTALWTNTFSAAPTLFTMESVQTAVTGMVAATGAVYTPLLLYFYAQGALSAASAATAALTTAVNHSFKFKGTVITNAATNWRLRLTQSAGTATPLAGSYYTIEKIATSTGTFAA